jgi:hypothetical protein
VYDFYLGDKDEIMKDEEGYLLSIKRMLPRWINSIPDSEFVAIHRLLSKHCEKKDVVLCETGVGASTIVLLYHAMKNNGVLFSWDIANPKGAELRGVLTDTLSLFYEKSLWNYWKFIAYDSLSPYLGIPILKEFDKKVDFVFCDSEHTWKTLKNELLLFSEVLIPGAIVSIDDANLSKKDYNSSYINMIRKKIGLTPIRAVPDNECRFFGMESQDLLNQLFSNVQRLKTSYNDEYKDDIYFSYYSKDRKQADKMGMENINELQNRFMAWKVGDKMLQKR